MEVKVRLRFTTPSLGNVRSETLDRMMRDPEGDVIFLQSWWRAVLSYGAQAYNRYEKDIDLVQTDTKVKGELSTFRRYYKPNEFKMHEAFLAGAEIEVRFCLPRAIGPEEIKELLTLAGRYVGVSPYGHKQDYGRFLVLSVEPAR